MLGFVVDVVFERFQGDGLEEHKSSGTSGGGGSSCAYGSNGSNGGSGGANDNSAALKTLGMLIKANVTAKYSKRLLYLVQEMRIELSTCLIETFKIICEFSRKDFPAMALIQNKLYEECSSIIRRHTELRLDSAVSSSWTTASSPTLGRRTSHSSSLFQRPTELISGLGLHLSPKQPSRHNSRAHGHHGGQFPLSASDEQSASLVLALETLHSFDFYTRHPQGAHRVLQTVRDSAIKLLDDEDSYVRKCAAITCCKVLNRSLGDSGFMSSLKMNGSTDNDIFYILERLLMVGVADDCEEIRLSIFNSMTPRLDPFMAKAENLTCLLDAINDESISVCNSAVGVIARLAFHCPRVIMPQIRKILVQLLCQLKQKEDTRLLRNSIVLLTELIKGANILLKPYVESIYEPLFNLLDADEVEVYVVAALGELSIVDSGTCLVPQIDILLTRISKLIDEKGAVKRQTMALKALGQIIGTTGYVIRPYLSHPELLKGIIRIIQKSDGAPGDAVSHELRLEATRTFGILGVVDPEKMSRCQLKYLDELDECSRRNEAGAAALAAGSLTSGDAADPKCTTVAPSSPLSLFSASITEGKEKLQPLTSSFEYLNKEVEKFTNASVINSAQHNINRARISGARNFESGTPLSSPLSLDEYYASATISALINILNAPMLKSHHSQTVKLAVQICKLLCASHSVPMIEDLVMCCVNGISQNATGEGLDDHFELLRLLINSAQEKIQPFLPAIVGCIDGYWQSENAARGDADLRQLLLLVESIHLVLSTDCFMSLLPKLLPRMINVLKDDDPYYDGDGNSGNCKIHFKRQLMVLETIAKIGPSLAEHMSTVVSVITKLLDGGSMVVVHDPEKRRQSVQLSMLCVKVMMHITKSDEFYFQFSSRMVHVLVSLASHQTASGEDERDLRDLAMKGLCCMVHRLGQKYLPYILPVKAILSKKNSGGVARGNSSGGGGSSSSSNNNKLENIYHSLIMKVVKGKSMPPSMPPDACITTPKEWSIMTRTTAPDHRVAKGMLSRKMSTRFIKKEELQQACSVSGRNTSGDWTEWMRRFSLELLRQSPSPILHCCKGLAEFYQPLAHELLNAAFMSVWSELMPNELSSFEISEECMAVAGAVEAAIEAPHMPPEILQDLLNMIEFVELHDKKLPIDLVTLGNQSRKAHAMAKALRYKEMEYSVLPNKDCIEGLIGINNLLGLDDAAKGILNRANEVDVKVMPSWQEKLGNWEEALRLYEETAKVCWDDVEGDIRERDSLDGGRMESINCSIGEIRCRAALDDNEVVLDKCDKLLLRLDCLVKSAEEEEGKQPSDGNSRSVRSAIGRREDGQNQRKKTRAKLDAWMAEAEVLGAKSAWKLGRWQDLEKYVRLRGSEFQSALESQGVDNAACYFDAVLSIQESDFESAQAHINRARERIIPVLSSMLGDFSYTRAHECFVTVQQLSELEEIIDHKKLVKRLNMASAYVKSQSQEAEIKSLEKLKLKWDKRMEWIPKEPELWRQMLNIRGLVYEPASDADVWMKYEKICRRHDLHNLSYFALCKLGVKDIIVNLGSNSGSGALGPSAGRQGDNEIEGSMSFLQVNPLNSPLKKLRKMSNDCEQQREESKGLLIKEEEEEGQLGSSNDTKDANADAESEAGFKLEGLSGKRGSESPAELHQVVEPRFMYCIFKYMWATDHKVDAISGLENFCADLKGKSGPSGTVSTGILGGSGVQMQLLGRCLLKVAKWKVALQEETKKQIQYDEIIKLQREATKLRPRYYKAWHSWALMNYRCMQDTPKVGKEESRKRNIHVVDAARGFFRSLSLASGRPTADILQDTLRLLTVWFENGKCEKLNECMEKGLQEVSVDTWLFVIPQLIARIHTQHPRVNRLLQEILCKVGRAHPQALIYPITVATNTGSLHRREAARAVIAEMRKSSKSLVDEANLVSAEIIKLSITWHEAWHEGLEEASKMFFGEDNVEGMMRILMGLHNELKQSTVAENNYGFNSVRAASFIHSYGRDLEEASNWLHKYKLTERSADLYQAWGLYYKVFRRITKQLDQLEKIELQHVSPLLAKAKSLSLAVPGTYRSHAPIVRIAAFKPSMDVIVSKQRPRKMTILGSDGADYTFLLKGHEDLRQDERVMQLFGLVNALLAQDKIFTKSRAPIAIRTYSVMPLSNNSGVIGWVPDCDTLHSLVKQYREHPSRKIRLNLELKLMAKYSSNNYDSLPRLGKLEVFEKTISLTKGEELSKMIFLTSQNSEIWLGRRTNFTKSAAVTSIAGYILGLGDRHPNNLMIDRQSGRIVHIDFGDCWEVCKSRKKFPEGVPFRLTRMMVNAMEASGLDGSFRADAEAVMRCLRGNKESLTAMLEAFVHDPLITWRLLADAEVEVEEGNEVKRKKGKKGSKGMGNHEGDAASRTEPKKKPRRKSMIATFFGTEIEDESSMGSVADKFK